MKTPITQSKEKGTVSDNRLPAIYHYGEKLFQDGLKSKLACLKFIIDMIERPDAIIRSAIDETAGEIHWEKFETAAWSNDHGLAIQWMKSIWTEKFHVVSESIFGVWPSQFEIRRAIFLALAQDAQMRYMIDSYHWDEIDRVNQTPRPAVA